MCKIRFQQVVMGLLGLLTFQTSFAQIQPEIFQTFGYRIPSPEWIGIWWCEGTRKVGRESDGPGPESVVLPIGLAAARNEFESFQLVLRSDRPASVRSIRMESWFGIDGLARGVVAALPIQIRVVEYVQVLLRSDTWGAAGAWPDPLLPFAGPLPLPPDVNQPFYITLYVPKDTPPGRYTNTLNLELDVGGSVRIPLELRVFGFALPEAPSTQTAYYSDVDWTWHRFQSFSERRQIWDLYMQMYKAYRLAPYSPHLYAPITWTNVGTQLQVSFSDFDAAMSRYLDEFGFTAFNLFGHKSPPFPSPLEGYFRFDTNWFVRFEVLMDRIVHHLRLRGWMDRAYCYWIDEPRTNDMPALIAGMDALRAAAPDLRRLLTFNVMPPEPWNSQLNGRVDIWTPMANLAILPRFTNRMAFGEELWWYVCVDPPAPYPNYFIDHPAWAHRIRFWAQQVYGVRGDLYWAINYWARPDHTSPWERTRSWDWSRANGDGLLVYPPTRQPPTNAQVVAPIATLRLEQVREGLEDREYFWVGEKLLAQAERRLGPQDQRVQQLRERFQAALALVPNLAQLQPEVTDLYHRRRALAEAMEAVDEGWPWWVREPVSKGVASGERCVLAAEALGWPVPAYQWYRDGEPIPGATKAQLILSSFSALDEGTYFVTASNPLGTITSRVARVLGTWDRAPEIVHQPQGRVVDEGWSVVLTVAAVPETVMNYQWYRNGTPLTNATARRAALDLGRVTHAANGDYWVVISNALGVTTSAVATVLVKPPAWEYRTFLRSSGSWKMWYGTEPPPEDWTRPDFDDGAWATVQAPVGFGYEDSQPATVLPSTNLLAPHSVAFRKRFYAVRNPATNMPVIALSVLDGAVVYLNGKRIFEFQAPQDSPIPWGPATGPGAWGWLPLMITIPTNAWVDGTNTLAVSVHRYNREEPLVAWWSFDAPGGWWLDAAGRHHLQLRGTGPTPIAARWQTGITNAGADGWLEAADHPDLRAVGPFTIGGWFAFGQQTGADPASVAIEKPGEYALYYTGTQTNRYRFRLGDVEVSDQTAGTRSGQWRFVVAWFDGTNACIQVDNGTVWRTNATAPTPGSEPVRLLRRLGPLGGFAADDVFFFRRVLSAQERQQLYFNGVQAILPAPALWFNAEAAGSVASLPVIASQIGGGLHRVVGRAGEPAWLELNVVSAWPVQYQWLKDGVPVPGATDRLLRWSQLHGSDTGWYSLMAKNRGGAVTSAPIRLVVVERPQLQWAPTATRGIGQLSWSAVAPDLTVVCEVSTNLVDWMEWFRWGPGEHPTHVPVPMTNIGNQGFYRLRLEW